MANNPYVNKVEFGNQTVMDISDTTATAADVLSGKKFYTASGAPMTGALVPGTITEVQANGTSIATSGVANIPAASTSEYGVTKLNNTTSSTSTSEAATAAVVKQLKDEIDHPQTTNTTITTGGVFGNYVAGYGCKIFLPFMKAPHYNITITTANVYGVGGNKASSMQTPIKYGNGIEIPCTEDFSGKYANFVLSVTEI